MSSIQSSPDALLADPLYPRLKEHVVGSTGLNYYADKDADLASRVSRRLSRLGVHDCASYLDILCDPLHGASELDELIAEITIGETHFFRHREHFDALRDVVFPDLLMRNSARNSAWNGPTQSLRIWCAGCADGPEPYSLAILLKREIAHQLLGWEVSILGTDINRHSLARAREGKFDEWALRSMPEDLRRAYFFKQGKYWNIAPEYKEAVSFQYHNLIENSFPSLVNNLLSFDLIICRNVMIYFGADLMRRTIDGFHACLVPGGWLLVGPSEPNMVHFTSFRAVNAPGATLYQKLTPSVPEFRAEVLTPPAPPLAVEAPRSSERAGASHGPTLEDVRRQADSGDWETAAQCCERLLERDKLNSTTHFYHGLVMEQMREHAVAEESLRRAIYLDRRSILAHYYLGLVLQSRGNVRQAIRSFENTLDLLRHRPDADSFADADGVTAGELKKLATMQLEILNERS